MNTVHSWKTYPFCFTEENDLENMRGKLIDPTTKTILTYSFLTTLSLNFMQRYANNI